MSVFPDTKRPMQLCAAIVSPMPVYEATGIETDKAELRERVTQCLCALTNQLYMGCYSIGETFRISYAKLLYLQTNLVLKDEDTIGRLRKYFKTLDPWSLVAWIDKLLDNHKHEREIEFKWMSN